MRQVYATFENEVSSLEALRKLRFMEPRRWNAAGLPKLIAGIGLYRQWRSFVGIQSVLTLDVPGQPAFAEPSAIVDSPERQNLVELIRECLSDQALSYALRRCGYLEHALAVLDTSRGSSRAGTLRAAVLTEIDTQIAEQALAIGDVKNAFERSLNILKRNRLHQKAGEVCLQSLYQRTWDLCEADPPRYDEAISVARSAYAVMSDQPGAQFELAWALRRKAEHLHYLVDPIQPDHRLQRESMDLYIEAWNLRQDSRERTATFVAVADVLRSYLRPGFIPDLTAATIITNARAMLPWLVLLSGGPADERTKAELESRLMSLETAYYTPDPVDYAERWADSYEVEDEDDYEVYDEDYDEDEDEDEASAKAYYEDRYDPY